jgi:hypothetical protein
MVRSKVQLLLDELCKGLAVEEVPAALQGLLASQALTRAAALSALPHVPSLASGAPQLFCWTADQAILGSLQAHMTTPAAAPMLFLLLCIAGCSPAESRSRAMLWMARFDVDEANAQAAQQLCKLAQADLPEDFVQHLAAALSHQHDDVRSAAAAALAAGIEVITPIQDAHGSKPN